jgi:hypothetical protein
MTMRTKRLATFACLAAIIFSLGGCTKCGFIWDQSRACHADQPR